MKKKLKKYYVIKFSTKIPKPSLLISDWNECKNILQSKIGGRVKSFKTLIEAEKYLTFKSFLPKDQNTIHIYVDGSFKTNNYYAGWGWVAVDSNSNKIDQDFGLTMHPAESRNIDGELEAVIKALKKITNKYLENPIIIYYDYQGIESWFTGEWEARSKVSKNYLLAIASYKKENKKIFFKKVMSHTGNYWNDYADELAQKSLTNQ